MGLGLGSGLATNAAPRWLWCMRRRHSRAAGTFGWQAGRPRVWALSTYYLRTIYVLSTPLVGPAECCEPTRDRRQHGVRARCESSHSGPPVRAAHRAVERGGVRELVVRRVHSELDEAHHLQQGTIPKCSRHALAACIIGLDSKYLGVPHQLADRGQAPTRGRERHMQHEPARGATHEAASAHVQAVQHVGAAPCRCRAHMVAGERELVHTL